jgi:hypothetical protein
VPDHERIRREACHGILIRRLRSRGQNRPAITAFDRSDTELANLRGACVPAAIRPDLIVRMGIEYRIRLAANSDKIDQGLRATSFFSDFEAAHRLYLLRFDPSDTIGQPNAGVKIEPDGLYFCDNGGAAAERAIIFRSILDFALKRSQKIEIEEP